KDLVTWLDSSRFAVSGSRAKVTYHDACHLAHAQGITAEPRELVKAKSGGELVELAESDLCCGSAGSYNLTEPEMASRLQKRKVQNIIDSGAEVVVTTNPGCLLQIQSGLRKAGAHHIRAIHIADYLLEVGTTDD
ncbi:MAG TPA: (Fe-S)-binding protein, partial [Gammaproteobacteria bacterium]|nr:(Fe-S)-binding protein [Gammaproteobacteria bacterium]